MNKYRASIATAVLGVASLTNAQSLGHNSFSSSMIASAMAKFHGVKAPTKLPTPSTELLKTALPKQDINPTTVVVAQVAPAPLPANHPESIAVKTAAPTTNLGTTPGSNPSIGMLAVATSKPLQAPEERVPTQQELERAAREIAISGPMVDPSKIDLEMPADPMTGITQTAPPKPKLKVKWVEEGYFDAGYERLLGTFSTQIVRYGIRYGQNDLHMYFKNQTLDTNGTGLPYPQAVVGTSVGIEARHWFPGDKIYASVSLGEGIGGLDANMADFRYGAAGYTSWANGRWFSDLYGELFYIALAADTFLDARIRSGRKLHVDKKGYLWDYVVGQFWVSGQVESPTENRAEVGWGIGYVFQNAISINFELRGGYAYRSGVDQGNDRAYFNPTIILSGGFYKGFFNY